MGSVGARWLTSQVTEDRPAQQLALLPGPAQARLALASARSARPSRSSAPLAVADTLPVARVLVDVPLAHLDRPFDYLVPARWDQVVRSGARVKVRFAGQDVDGFVVERVETSDHPGRLAPLRRAVSAEPVLTPEIARLTERVATRYAGTRADVLRLAIPPRHAAVEKAVTVPAAGGEGPEAGRLAPGSGWSGYRGGPGFLRELEAGRSPRRVWTALPGEDWAARLADAAAATSSSGRGALLCVPDRRALDRLDAALRDQLGPGRHVVLSADLGPAARYRSFLAVSRGDVRVVAGTRAAAFAPVHDLGLVGIWDDGDDLYAEPRAPYPHIREVLLLRAHDTGCAALVAGVARSVEGATLVGSGWAHGLVADRVAVRAAAPLVSITGATNRELERDPVGRGSRLPSSASRLIRAALEAGPVLVQTPRSGYAGALVCDSCRAPARCGACTGPLQLPAVQRPPTCGWCGQVEQLRRCASCGGRGLRAAVIGERRTAEELGRAFPRTPVSRSAGDHVLDRVADRPAIVVATPGAEPPADGGYAAVVLLDTWLMLARPELRTTEESVRRWFNAASLARPAEHGGRVIAVGDAASSPLQALVRWDPAGFAEREAADRVAAHLPPASRLAALSGPAEVVDSAVAALVLPPGAELLGPVPVRAPGPRAAASAEDDWARVVVRVPRGAGSALSRALGELQRARSARKLPPVRVQVDPASLG